MASVPLDFLPPTASDIVALLIYEGPAVEGPFQQIERVTAVGTYPNYITRYTTDAAANASNWFAIAWENADGLITPLSASLQGGSTTLVQTLIDRVLLRDPSLNEVIVAQEAEAAISEFFMVDDPYTVDPKVAPRILSGLTYFTMARAYVAKASTTAATAGGKWVAGLVSLDTSSSSKTTNVWDNIEALLRIANRELGRSYSVILLLEEIEVAGRYKQLVAADLSRNIIEVQ
jgi:hypothetical protein